MEAGFRKKAECQQEKHLLMPLLDLVLLNLNRPLWQQERQGASSSAYLEELNTSLSVLEKGLGLKFPTKAVAEMAWGHLRASERAILKAMTYQVVSDGKSISLPIKEDLKQLRLAVANLEIGGPTEPYYDRDSSMETQRLSLWLRTTSGTWLLTWLT